MHFSIPDTEVIKDDSGSYVAYNIHINGSFHCSLRYRQLYQFHLQLKKAFGAQSLCNFPPKKFFPLTGAQLEERRSQIEKYIQIASQDSQIVSSDLFNGFFLAAQQETHSKVSKHKDDFFDIYQLNWQNVKLPVDTSENSQVVLRRYAQAINLDAQFIPYFCLYMVQRIENDFKTIRRLQNFESPFLTLITANNRSTTNANHLILVRKSYWDNSFDEDLYKDKASLNIIYWQALHEVEKGYVQANKATRNRLTSLQAMGEKVEYLKIAQTLKHYSHIHFEPCYCDHPVAKSYVKLSAGNQELNVHLINSNEEYTFRVIRIKCWRLTTSNNASVEDTTAISESSQLSRSRFELSIEYLVSTGSLKWITIHSAQAVLISMCLQSMVEEMLVKREGKRFKSEGLSLRYNTSPNYTNHLPSIQLNESTKTSENHSRKDGSNANSTALKEQQNESKPRENIRPGDSGEECKQIEFNSTDMSQVKNVKYSRLVENTVFDEIGDDAL